MLGGSDLLALTKLLEDSEEACTKRNPSAATATSSSSSNHDEGGVSSLASYASPGSIGPSVMSTVGGPSASSTSSSSSSTTSVTKPSSKKKEIWSEDELAGKGSGAPGGSATAGEGVSSEYVEDPSDTRARPEYEIRFKQHVGVYDVYSGINFEKDPSTMRCEEFVVLIQMPKTASSASISCDVKELCLDVRSDEYKLILPLSRRVYTNKGSAKWDDRSKTMTVNLVINYENYITKIV